MGVEEGFVKVSDGNVWYRKVVSEENLTPLLILHGGPGFSSLPLHRLDKLADKRTVIYYDQLGAGYSKGPNDPSLWRLERFVEELGQVRKELGLEEVHILGHSWGTTLLASYLLTKPIGVKSAIFSSPCLSAPLWAQDAKKLLEQLPAEIHEVILRCEENGETDSEEYKLAMKEFSKRFICRVEVNPEERAKVSELGNLEVYNTMWGPSEFCVTGNLKDFDCTPRLHEIKTPSLFLCGRYDEATPESTSYFSSLVPNSKLHIFEESAHSGYREQPEEYVQVLQEFINCND
ncbi:proline iminopeptidase-family hydrolase [Bacillus sp. CGMCC 1.16607]|uniref:proline iminopeptidase-family hydrolase n=1 Tax=Bacillus sp. CGMCC 1.16607 TaxID=3351842 RepID=UPI00362CC2B5